MLQEISVLHILLFIIQIKKTNHYTSFCLFHDLHNIEFPYCASNIYFCLEAFQLDLQYMLNVVRKVAVHAYVHWMAHWH